jgi:outer membrane protein assembly factor BamB
MSASNAWKLSFLICLSVACWPTAGWGRDWPQWGGSDGRNMAALDRGIPAAFVPGKKSSGGRGIDLTTTRNVKWVASLGTDVYSTPAVAGGRVFIGTSDGNLDDPRFVRTGGGVLLCLDEATGKLLWRLVVPRLTTGPKSRDFDAMGLGICSSPTVDGNRVYIVTNRNEVLCLDAEGMAHGNRAAEANRSMFSDHVVVADLTVRPKNGPVPA